MSELINVTRSSMPEFEEYCAEIRDIWDSHWLTNMGEKHKALQAALESYLGAEHVTLFTNGHLALENMIEAFGPSSAAAARRCSATSVPTITPSTRRR